MIEDENLKGLGGWLVLVGIGIVISPLKILFQVFPIYKSIFNMTTWNLLTTRGSENYKPLLVALIFTELIINICLVLGWLYIAYLYFTKNSKFPIFYSSIIAFSLFFIVADAILIGAIQTNVQTFDSDTQKEIMRSFGTVLIWVPYMRISKRVKATFVNVSNA